MKRPRRKSKREQPPARKHGADTATRLRIVSGEFGGRKISYNGDPATRPMKERTREAVFSLLGGKLPHTCTIDLFGGTGILAIESLSRGSQAAIILELMHRSVGTILGSLEMLELKSRVRVLHVDTLRWLRDFHAEQLELALPEADWRQPWVVFACPPYRLWTAETDKLTSGLAALMQASPAGSQFVCETDASFDLASALDQWDWDVRQYDPAFISLART